MNSSHPRNFDDSAAESPSRFACILTGLLFLLPSVLSAATVANRIVLGPDTALSGEPIVGLTLLVVAIPFERARVQLLIDGREIGSRPTPPYSFEIDFGPTAIEHRVSVVASETGTSEKLQWSRVINRGNQKLSLTLRSNEKSLEALTTSPGGDAITAVTFQDGDKVIATITSPPYTITAQQASGAAVVIATARTKSGQEIAEYFSAGTEVQAEKYNVRTVPLLVSVVDRDGAAKGDLSARSFRIYDKGREAKVLEFSRAFEQPISIALVLDASNSILHRIKEVRRAGTKFVETAMREGDSFALFSVRSVPKRELPLTKSKKAMLQHLGSMQPGGDTALYDGVASAIRELSEVKGRRAIVILSDGADTSSQATYEELALQVRKAAIPLYVIDYSENENGNVKTIEQLRLLATESGGFLDRADAGMLEARYEQIELDLRAQYLIRYQIADSGSSGEWRPVKVVVNSPSLSARTIRGYFTP